MNPRFTIGKIRGKYLVLELLLCTRKNESLHFLHEVNKSSRTYLVEMLKYIRFRACEEKVNKENLQKINFL